MYWCSNDSPVYLLQNLTGKKAAVALLNFGPGEWGHMTQVPCTECHTVGDIEVQKHEL